MNMYFDWWEDRVRPALVIVLSVAAFLGVFFGIICLWESFTREEREATRREQAEVLAKIWQVTPEEAYKLIPLINKGTSSPKVIPAPVFIRR